MCIVLTIAVRHVSLKMQLGPCHIRSSSNFILQQLLEQEVDGGCLGDAGAVDLDLIHSNDDPTTFFKDGKRKIDFVLVYEEKSNLDDLVDRTASKEDQQKTRWVSLCVLGMGGSRDCLSRSRKVRPDGAQL